MNFKEFEILYKTYQPHLVNFANFYLKNEQESIDLVQELFKNIWEKKEILILPPNPKSYLYKAVKNRCYNKLTRNKTKITEIEYLENVLFENQTPSDIIESRQSANQIDSLINKLPAKCREIFILSRYENMSYKEISAVLDISVKTVENQIGNALKFLRKNFYIILILIICFLEKY
ncbi:MAG: RNA polymerase sigma-70 factor [Bacteroidetes bacterium]|nr:RNA polymerase sigma-70 factor [Bacteroidota bacterium]